jgi:hypothetical protein
MRTSILVFLLACSGSHHVTELPDAPDGDSGERWSGTSHVTDLANGAIYDSTFTFAPDPALGPGHFLVANGEVNLTKQPTSSGDCTITVDASHPMAEHDGQLAVDESGADPILRGQGDTIWLATYTSVCPSGTSTMQQPYSVAWWPFDPTAPAPPQPAPDGKATFTASSPLASGTITIGRE